MKNYRTTSGKLVKSQVMGCRTRCFRGPQWQPRSIFTLAHRGYAAFCFVLVRFVFLLLIVRKNQTIA